MGRQADPERLRPILEKRSKLRRKSQNDVEDEKPKSNRPRIITELINEKMNKLPPLNLEGFH